MMQLINDVAPRAELAFHTAFLGQASFARGIKELAAKDKGRADVIVDDILYLAEPMFQDGIIARAVNRVKSQGVPYFSAAGNGGRSAFDSGSRGFVDSGFVGAFGRPLHDFNPGSGVDPIQRFVVGTGETIIIFQWDQPFASASIGGSPGSSSDLDLIVAGPNGGTIIAHSFADNIGGDAIEGVGLINSGPPESVGIAFEHYSGPAPGFMKYVIFGPGSNDVKDPPSSFPAQYQTNSGTLYGHAGAAGAMTVGAASFRKTPAFGVSPPRIEPFSTVGGTPIHFNNRGKRISPVIRLKPEIVAPDGTITTFFGNRNKLGVFNPGGHYFFGTSAAAPHAAAVAALMLELDPDIEVDHLYDVLKETAIDMNDPATGGFDSGFDFATGHGLIDAFRAANRVNKRK
jgi:subtilisin family serine protease